MTALGSVLGRKVGIKPKQKDDWTVLANFWAVIIGRPGILKSPAMEEVVKLLKRLEVEAEKAYAEQFKKEKHKIKLAEMQREARLKKLKGQLEKNPEVIPAGLEEEMAKAEINPPPPPRRYMVNDCTYEALGVVLADNPDGVLTYRDELMSLLKLLDREDHAPARGFFLSAWNCR
jgi:hypothetical protein